MTIYIFAIQQSLIALAIQDEVRMPFVAIRCHSLSNVNAMAFFQKSKKTATHSCSGLLFAHTSQHLLLRLLTQLSKGDYMYALQKHSAKILFFYYIKKTLQRTYQQFIIFSLSHGLHSYTVTRLHAPVTL